MACSSSPSGTLKLVTGEEDAAVTFAGVTAMTVEWVDGDAGAHTLAQVAWPASSINLGSVDEGTVGQIQVKGSDATGAHVVFGSVIPLQFGALDGVTLPVFMQRVGAFARLPQPPNDSRTSPLLGVLGGRYLVMTGGDDPSTSTTSQLYDLLTLQPLLYPPVLPPAESMALVGTTAYMITESGATLYDLSSSDGGTVALPSGLATAASVAGGATVVATDGTQYIVGGTRVLHEPTDAILRIDGTGTATWIHLAVARQGAAAVWLDGPRGLLVAGGSDKAPGAELVLDDGEVKPIDVPADPSMTAGAATLDDDHLVVLAGGSMPDLSDPGVRVLDLQCATPCVPSTWPALPTPLAFAQAYGMPGKSSVVVVGSVLGGGATHVFLLTEQGPTEIPTRVPHTHARTVASPVGITPGSFFLVGGAPEIEAFAPAF
jgi:hypothetical protein